MGYLLAELQSSREPTRGRRGERGRRRIRRPRPRPLGGAAGVAVLDPEVPVLTIDDLGVLRDVAVDADGRVDVVITPTYSGCPAMDAIRDDVVSALHAQRRRRRVGADGSSRPPGRPTG